MNKIKSRLKVCFIIVLILAVIAVGWIGSRVNQEQYVPMTIESDTPVIVDDTTN